MGAKDRTWVCLDLWTWFRCSYDLWLCHIQHSVVRNYTTHLTVEFLSLKLFFAWCHSSLKHNECFQFVPHQNINTDISFCLLKGWKYNSCLGDVIEIFGLNQDGASTQLCNSDHQRFSTWHHLCCLPFQGSLKRLNSLTVLTSTQVRLWWLKKSVEWCLCQPEQPHLMGILRQFPDQ